MINEEEIHAVFESIGLSRNETAVFIDLLRSGKSSANDLSKRTGIHRSNVYDVLEGLTRKGLADSIVENDKNFYYPIQPKDLLDYTKQRQMELEKIIPILEEIKNKKVEERKVFVAEGIQSVKNILMSLLELKEPIYLYGMPREVKEMLGHFLEEFHIERIAKGILFKGIYNKDALKRVRELNTLELTEARYFPSSYDSKISTTICGNRVVLQFWEYPVSVIVIENESIANSYKNYFKILWDEALGVGNGGEE